jgi:hypothetical protein
MNVSQVVAYSLVGRALIALICSCPAVLAENAADNGTAATNIIESDKSLMINAEYDLACCWEVDEMKDEAHVL